MLSLDTPPRPEALCPSAQKASWLCDGCNSWIHAACEARPRRVLGLLTCPSCRSKSETEGGEGSSGLLAEGAAKRARTAVTRLGHNDSWGEGQASRWASCEGGQAGTPWYSQAARRTRKRQLQASESGEMLRRHSGSDTGDHSGSDTELQVDESDEEGAAAMMLFMPGRQARSPEGGKRARSRTGSEAGTPGPLPAVVATELLAFAFSSSGSYVSNAAHTNGAVKPLVAGRFEAQNQAREENVPIFFEAMQHDEMSSLPPQPPQPSVATGDGTVAAQVWIGRYESRALASTDDVEQLFSAAQSGTAAAQAGSQAAARVGSQEKEQPAMWTVEEDLLIVDLVETIGKRWARIAAALPGRTENGVRNRWNRMEKAQQVRKDKGDGHGYRCGRCGQPKRGHICPALTSGERLEGENLVKRATALSAMASRKIGVQQAAWTTSAGKIKAGAMSTQLVVTAPDGGKFSSKLGVERFLGLKPPSTSPRATAARPAPPDGKKNKKRKADEPDDAEDLDGCSGVPGTTDVVEEIDLD